MTPQDIKSFRKDKGYTQGQMAQLLGVSLRTVQYWESGKVAPPSMLYFATEYLNTLDDRQK